ncbi:hypothetical protein DRN67_01475 [Candidatus Micrarchaeota archaeon]|nr:MAG: hypothetical protein DRN67_01475 [Candidatus Micrarchaeota archaeon]
MRILITGAAGLYGVHLVDDLLGAKGVEKIIGVDDFSRSFLVKDPFELVSRRKEFEGKFELRKMKFYDLEVADFEKVDVVIHLAASISIPESMEDGKAEVYFKNNEYGTFMLMQKMLRTKKWPLMIYASSPEVYGDAIYTPMDINHPMLPRSIYAVTKLAAEKHCSAMNYWYKYPVVIIRNFNTYGENQSVLGNSAVVANFIYRALKNENLVVHNEGKQGRDFQYVKDAVRAYTLVAQKGEELSGLVFNIGTGEQISILNLAKKIIEISGSDSEIVFQKGRSADIKALEADYSLIREKTGWKPKYTLDQGLKRTIDWYRKVLK